ncbi:nickel-dependent hydrogenase large subunit [Heliobacterium gestii]|uniref:Nickel-dependent hydrogenase large subunit n=1 Tax=Heliomicrobium gestii TaxID=2699 RepID=A0A845LAF6_HELGE|nr:nickel-dependent hydrogenase large subunit [Heliomicrobium gestii]MBM7866521.1 hydrogenase large subunit [Heliomicrobium gestii]MZP43198.1 nickel-dependent hydrogenase large subunit [Heliomicrobium gestii]
MSPQRVLFSPVTRLSGLLSAQVILEGGRVVDAFVCSPLFRGFEAILRDRAVTDAVYLTQRVCGICSLAHGATASYLLDELYDHEISENAQLLRNIMYGADFLQNHLRHFYLFSLPDFVQMPERPPFLRQNLTDARFDEGTTARLVAHYGEAIGAAQKSHRILALFGGKAPHQHSFVHGGVSVAPTADKVAQACALLQDIERFIETCLLPDTALIAKTYGDYFFIGQTPMRLLSFGLFRFGPRNERFLWKGGAMTEQGMAEPRSEWIREETAHSWFRTEKGELAPDPDKPGGYSFVKTVRYAGEPFEVGPLARMRINGFYDGGTSTMDRICARSLEMARIARLMGEWLRRLVPGEPPIAQKKTPVKGQVTAITDAMRGVLLHRAEVEAERVVRYDIITPTVWNFSPKDGQGRRGPVESALVGTEIGRPDSLFTILGRIIRAYDPCLACATHVVDRKKDAAAFRFSELPLQ